jgi:hypothetical protein
MEPPAKRPRTETDGEQNDSKSSSQTPISNENRLKEDDYRTKGVAAVKAE